MPPLLFLVLFTPLLFGCDRLKASQVSTLPQPQAVLVTRPEVFQGQLWLSLPVRERPFAEGGESLYFADVGKSPVSPFAARPISVRLPLPGLRRVQGQLKALPNNQARLEFKAPPRLLDGLLVQFEWDSRLLVENELWSLPAESILNPTGEQAALYLVNEESKIELLPIEILNSENPQAVVLRAKLSRESAVLRTGQHKVFPGEKVQAELKTVGSQK